jgi:hypothetical protein
LNAIGSRRAAQTINSACADDLSGELAHTRNDLDDLPSHWSDVIRSAYLRRDEDLMALQVEHN